MGCAPTAQSCAGETMTTAQASPPDGRFSEVSAWYEHSCGLRADGTIECWGRDNHGQRSVPDSVT